MGLMRERFEEVFHILPEEGVVADRLLVGVQFGLGGQLSVLEQVGHFEEAGVLGELFDRIPPVAQYPLFTVDVGDGGLAFGGVGESTIEGYQSRCRT